MYKKHNNNRMVSRFMVGLFPLLWEMRIFIRNEESMSSGPLSTNRSLLSLQTPYFWPVQSWAADDTDYGEWWPCR